LILNLIKIKKVKPDPNTENLISAISRHAHVLNDAAGLVPLLDLIGDAKIVMLGEASHGTHEYYTWRAQISKKLIAEKGFNFIAVEGDWPDCYRINRFVKGYDSCATANECLQGFNRWPTWMWANWETAAFAEWLHAHNNGLSETEKRGFYGLDVYSLWESMESIIEWLKKNDPDALSAAENAFQCFEPYRKSEGQAYARASLFVPELCQSEVATLLKEVRLSAAQHNDPESGFSAAQNAMIAVNAEKYYRAMIQGGSESWNIRDSHMQDTLERLLEFHGPDAKAIVWAHNTHIGDARATSMAREGMYNLGELSRKRYGDSDVVLVGFGSYSGTVIAGESWGAPMQIMPIPEAEEDSWEYHLKEAGGGNKLLITDDIKDIAQLQQPLGHRAIGVVYDPDYEHLGNFVPSIIPERYDAFIYLEETQALHPMHGHADNRKTPDLYPFGV
jgi:erythromycin esterase